MCFLVSRRPYTFASSRPKPNSWNVSWDGPPSRVPEPFFTSSESLRPKHRTCFRNEYRCARATKRDRTHNAHPQKHPHSDFHSVSWNRCLESCPLGSLATRLCDRKGVVSDCPYPGAPIARFSWCSVNSHFLSVYTRRNQTVLKKRTYIFFFFSYLIFLIFFQNR